MQVQMLVGAPAICFSLVQLASASLTTLQQHTKSAAAVRAFVRKQAGISVEAGWTECMRPLLQVSTAGCDCKNVKWTSAETCIPGCDLYINSAHDLTCQRCYSPLWEARTLHHACRGCSMLQCREQASWGIVSNYAGGAAAGQMNIGCGNGLRLASVTIMKQVDPLTAALLPATAPVVCRSYLATSLPTAAVLLVALAGPP